MSAEAILDLQDRRTTEVFVEEWDTELTIRELDWDGGIEFIESLSGEQQFISAADAARVIAMSVIDENGELVFSGDDIPKLAKKNAKALRTIWDAIVTLNGATGDLEKKSEASQD